MGIPRWIYLRETGADGRTAGVSLRLDEDADRFLRTATLEEIGALTLFSTTVAREPQIEWREAIRRVAQHLQPFDEAKQRRVRSRLRGLLVRSARRNAEFVA